MKANLNSKRNHQRHLHLTVMVAAAISLTACGGAPDDAGSAGAPVAAQNQTPAPAPHPGEQTYREFCFSCHTPGLSGAPKLGDVEAWAPRIAKGHELLVQATIEGIPPAMPPRGLCMACTDEDIANVVDYMIVMSR